MLCVLLAVALSATEHDDSIGARDCLALVIFSEARSESWLGQGAVGQVVINRALESGQDVCSVAMAPGQFYGLEHWPFPREPQKIDARAWEKAREIADAVLLGDYVIAPGACRSATYFYHTKSGFPRSFRGLTEVCQIGEHTFLKVENNDR